MKEKCVSEIMIPLDKYPHIPYWFTLRQAMAEFEKAEFNIEGRVSRTRFVLVFDEEYQLLGTVRRRDIMRGLEPDFLHDTPPAHRKDIFDEHATGARLFSVISYDKMVESIRKQADRPVKDVLIPIPATVNHDDHIVKAMYEIVEYNVALIPVLEDGNVAGVVRSNDLFHEVAQLLL